MTSSVLKRLEAIEKALAARQSPQLVMAWTPSLAARIGPKLPANYQCVCLSFAGGSNAEEAFEAKLRKDPAEAARLDRLLQGNVS
jgi:hypothetical protein